MDLKAEETVAIAEPGGDIEAKNDQDLKMVKVLTDEDVHHLPKPTISACMIVRNEEEVIARCLESALVFCDEVIFLDTGSTDKTIEIAKGFGEKVKVLTHYKWNDDFSEARNEAQKHATQDWIYIIDADEYMNLSDAQRVCEVLKKYRKYVGVTCQVQSQGPTTLDTMFPSVRFFKREAGLEWTGIVHNQLSVRGLSVAVSDLRVIHTGYDMGDEKMEAKFQRTISLLKKNLSNNDQTPFTHCDLARSYAAHRDWHEAIYHAERSLQLAEEKFVPMGKTALVYCYHLLWVCYNCVGDDEMAYLALVKGLRVCPDHPDLWHDLTITERSSGNMRVAKYCAEEYVRCGKRYMKGNSIIPSGVVTLYDVNNILESLNLGNLKGGFHNGCSDPDKPTD